ncbi:hypothetical protein ACNO7T_20295 [Vibrio campbellii]
MPKIVITENNILDVVSLIDTWQGKLTWPLLCERVTELLGLKGGAVTRQTLSSYKSIQEAYTAKKQKLRETPETTPRAVDTDEYVKFLESQVKSLNIELERALELNERYKQRFVQWQYNAYVNGLRIDSLDDAIDMLERPLQEIKRRTGGA